MCNVAVSPKASPRSSPFTSPRSSNQWCRTGDGGLFSRRGCRFDADIRETKEEDVDTKTSTKERSQHLTIPKGMEPSSSAETLIGMSVTTSLKSKFKSR